MNLTLIRTLEQVNHPIETWNSPDGTSLLVLPYGGRVLGLFAPESEKNFLWTNPVLNSVERARALYQSEEWHNSGGDRTWLSPEVDFFLPHYPDLKTYWQPREFDPGAYRFAREDDRVTLINRFSYKLSRSQREVGLEIRKELGPAYNPLRNLFRSHSISYAGYTLKTRLAFTSNQLTPTPVSLWNLLQLPYGGEFVIPTFSKAIIRTHLGRINKSDLFITDRLVRYRTRAVGLHKFGMPAFIAIGRVGYVYADRGDTCLVVRNFCINPSREYVDVPWNETKGTGSVIEACNVNLDLGVFSELEYHTPAISGIGDDRVYQDESQVWAFRGAKSEIEDVARVLISSDI